MYLQEERVCVEIGLSAIERIKLRNFMSAFNQSRHKSCAGERAEEDFEGNEGMLQR